MYSEILAPVKVADCIIPKLWFKMYPEVSAPAKVPDCIIPKLRFKMYPEVLAPVKVVKVDKTPIIYIFYKILIL